MLLIASGSMEPSLKHPFRTTPKPPRLMTSPTVTTSRSALGAPWMLSIFVRDEGEYKPRHAASQYSAPALFILLQRKRVR